jgi:hypothetical protein
VCDHDEVATAEAGGWSFTVCEPTDVSGAWLIEVSPPGSSFIDLYFDIEGPEFVESVLRFIRKTRGQKQFGEPYVRPGESGPAIQTFTNPSITIGQCFGVDVELFKDGAEDDCYFVVIAGPHRNVLRLRKWGSDVGNVVSALESLGEQLADRR